MELSMTRTPAKGAGCEFDMKGDSYLWLAPAAKASRNSE
jgi:hypothetical protein